jgi:DNA mismatch repair protein MutL
MPRIQQLSRHLVNKIAAGEVIERPASVVKELVENALDAGATRIEVTCEDGGRKLIQVADDGEGMGADDARLAFAPHATSKLVAEEDLFNIATMGFRGEALASIASIAHVTLRTRRRDEDAGWEVAASGQEVRDPAPAPAAPGTTVIVRDLFFNTPARRKFMRTANTEFGHIAEQLTRLALPHPQVALTLRHGGRVVTHLTSEGSTARRIAELFTDDLADSLLPVRRATDAVDLAGFLAPPSAARNNAKWQYVFLNGRYIRDRLIAHAVREAYRGLLPPTKVPVVFLFLQIDPAEVDVNVHPTKIEVRFRDSNAIFGHLLAGLRETLQQADLRPEADLEPDNQPASKDTPDEQRRESLRQAMADFFKSAPTPQPRLSFPEGQRPVGPAPAATPPTSADAHATGPLPLHRPLAGPPVAPTGTEPAPLPHPPTDETSAPATGYDPSQTDSAPSAAGPAPIMQVHDSYIVAQTDEGLVIVDQHALHERVLYNAFRRRLADGSLSSQRMLIPQPLRVTAAETALLDNHADLLDQLGLELTPFGPDSLAVQRAPTLLAERGVEVGAFLREVLDTLADDDSADRERLLETTLATMACKAAVKAGDPLTEREMRDLLHNARRTDKPTACPHGRPTTLRMSLADLKKQFERT